MTSVSVRRGWCSARGFYPLTYCVRLVDNWLVVLLTGDRYIAVCHPLKSRTRRGTARTWTIIGLMTAVSVLFSLPRCFEFKLADNTANLHTKFAPTALTHSRLYVFFYRTSLCFVLSFTNIYSPTNVTFRSSSSSSSSSFFSSSSMQTSHITHDYVLDAVSPHQCLLCPCICIFVGF